MKYSTAIAAKLLLASLPFLFATCAKENCQQVRTYTIYTPVYKLKSEVLASLKSTAPTPLKNPGKLYIRGNYIFLNELDKGIHIIDNSNPASPRNISFIDIPGNLDIAVKGNTLYADMYRDMVTIDITNPTGVVVKKITENLFPYRSYGNGFYGAVGDSIIVDWNKRDTSVVESCNRNEILMFDNNTYNANSNGLSAAASSPYGKGGSMARFAIMQDRLYAVSTSRLTVYNITNANEPVQSNSVQVGWNIETIFPFKNSLFIGSQTGMFIYNVASPDAPVQTGRFSHVMSCDPVIADDDYAYVTLRSGTTCLRAVNQLEVLTLDNLTNPVLLKTYTMTNPHGLSKDGNLLFICDGNSGIKVYNATNVSDLQLLKTIQVSGAYDVIAFNNHALVVAADGFYQYDYTNPGDIRLISKLEVTK